MSQLTEAAVTIAMAIIGLAIIAALVSRRSNTTGVVQAISSGFGNTLATALSPVTGAMAEPNLSYPGSMGASFGAPNW